MDGDEMDHDPEHTGSDARTDERSPTPLYHQIYLQLRQRIVDGHYALGAQLPVEVKVAERFGVSRITARRAMDELARTGYVIRRPRQGTRVIWKGLTAPIVATVDSMLDSVRLLGRTDVTLLGLKEVTASNEVAGALGIAANLPVKRIERVRSIRANPISYVISYIPVGLGRQITAVDLVKHPLVELLAARGHAPAGGENRLTAVAADTRTSRLLEVEPGSPLLRVIGTVEDASGSPVEYLTALYRSDRFQFTIRFAGGTGLYGDDLANML